MDNKEYQKQWIEIGKKRGLDIDEYVYDKYNDELQNLCLMSMVEGDPKIDLNDFMRLPFDEALSLYQKRMSAIKIKEEGKPLFDIHHYAMTKLHNKLFLFNLPLDPRLDMYKCIYNCNNIMDHNDNLLDLSTGLLNQSIRSVTNMLSPEAALILYDTRESIYDDSCIDVITKLNKTFIQYNNEENPMKREFLKKVFMTEEDTEDEIFYLDKRFNYEQNKQIHIGKQRMLNTKIYAKPEFNHKQMRELRIGLQGKNKLEEKVNSNTPASSMRIYNIIYRLNGSVPSDLIDYPSDKLEILFDLYLITDNMQVFNRLKPEDDMSLYISEINDVIDAIEEVNLHSELV